jgi:hypothetical protein
MNKSFVNQQSGADVGTTHWGLKPERGFYTDSSHNIGVVQSPCTFKEVHNNQIDYNCSSTTARDFHCSSPI